jgi:class 3 adenylate cyclase
MTQVTILFSDIVQYTALAASVKTEELIDILNTMFSGFDELCDKHQCYKVTPPPRARVWSGCQGVRVSGGEGGGGVCVTHRRYAGGDDRGRVHGGGGA